MKNFKKIIVILMICVLALAVFVACDDNGSGSSSSLKKVLSKYADEWNFEVSFDVYVDDEQVEGYPLVYGYKDMFTMSIDYDDSGDHYTDYYSFADKKYYCQLEDGTYELLDENNEYYELYTYYNVEEFDISGLEDLKFKRNKEDDKYVARKAEDAGNAILGEFENSDGDSMAWTSVELWLQGENIYKIVAIADGTYTDEDGVSVDTQYKYELTFTKYGEIDFDLDDLDIAGVDDGGDDDGGDIGGDDGGDIDTTVNKTYTAVFTDKDFSNESGLTFTSSRKADNYDKSAVQFEQKKGSATVTTSGLENVTSVSVVMFTNSDTKKTYTVSVKVGDTTLYCDGDSTVTVNQNTDMNITFTSSVGVDGDVSIQLTPSGSGSMWLKSVEIICGKGGNGGNSGNGTTVKPTPTETMPTQVYDKSKLDKSTIQDAMLKYLQDEGSYSYVGIQSNPWRDNKSYTETRCLVVPVEFTDAKFDSGQLDKVKLAFNGTETDTGWQSVNSYYKKSSYGKLNLQYDFVTSPYQSSHNMSYYETTNFGTGRDGSTALLEEVMNYYDKTIDFSQYDNNGDDFIDAVYIIYAGDIDYDDAELYWAFVTEYYPESEDSDPSFDNKMLGYYLFAGADFIYEYTGTSNDPYLDNSGQYVDMTITGLKINASTFIHETGHLLNLDDYYDYDEENGSNNGLGGADMMDYTAGDHNPYSKLMLGWIEPTIVTSTQTITINAFESSGDCIMLLLDYNNTYFSEYLLIDLYANTGLNTAHANQGNSYLYYDEDTQKGAEYGVRIFHVSSDISNPYNDDYYSFTTNNNSKSDIPLIKLVQADGEADFSSDEYGLCWSTDLWQAGDKLSNVFPNYARNDNKKVNFDIEIVSASKTQATITITFNA